MKQLGLICGTFNPIHCGHLLIAECARDQFKLDRVLFVTSPKPPHRKDHQLEARARHEMVSLAVSGNIYFQASDLELNRSGESYTSDTVRQIIQIEKSKINLIIGSDNLPHINSWHDWSYLLANCRILVAPRLIDLEVNCQSGKSNMELPAGDFAAIDLLPSSISSSAIRQRLQLGKSIRYMVPDAVNKLIHERGYYLE